MTRVRKTAAKSEVSFEPKENQLVLRPFTQRAEKREAPVEESRVSFSLADIDIFPRETVQPKLRLGPVGDRYEQEADRVARRVVKTISSPDQDQIQRAMDVSLRCKVAGFAPAAGGESIGPDLESSIHGARGKGFSLSEMVRQPMERAFGIDFSSVRLHTDAQADRLNRSIQARAFTTGQDIFLRDGEYQPGSFEGQRLLAHELTHVVQQNRGALQRTQMQGTEEATETESEVQEKDLLDTSEDESGYLKELLLESGREEVKIGTKLHHVELRLFSSGLEIGVASEWEEISSIIKTLLDAASRPGTSIYGQEADINAISEPVRQAYDNVNIIHGLFLKSQEDKKAIPRLSVTSTKFKENREKKFKATEKYNRYRKKLTDASYQLTAACKLAIQQAWEAFGDFLPAHLLPATAVFQDRDFVGDLNVYTYHRGDASDPIPIMWYKDPEEYPIIEYNKNKYHYYDKVKIGGTDFGVSAANDPRFPNAFQLRKLAHNETREGQKIFNELFNSNSVKVGDKKAPALVEGKFDGDHVKDLGFGGRDQAENYWPLSAQINRRAFNGYNSRYIINYLDGGVGKSKAIGGMIGKYFVVKGFYGGPVPDESNSPQAGSI